MRIKISGSFVCYMTMIALLDSPEAAVGLISALVIHELGHYLMVKCIHEPVRYIKITPFGGVMEYQAGSSASKGIRGMLLSAAGLAGNYVLILILNEIRNTVSSLWIKEAMICNASMMFINMIPVLPLDGGAFLFSIGYYLFDLSFLINVLSVLGMLVGSVLCIMSIYGWMQMEILNLSLLLVGAYLVHAAWENRENMIVQNCYAIIQEKMVPDKKVRKGALYVVDDETTIHDLIKYIAQPRSACFFVRDKQGEGFCISEEIVYIAMLEDLTLTIGEIAKKAAKIR